MSQTSPESSQDAAPAANPYVGPQPFQKKDRDRFFGREREARDLLSLVESERLVLFYAQSGAGKSSLINACLIPRLEEDGFSVLPVTRVSGRPAGADGVENIYTYNLLLSLEQGVGAAADPARLAGMTLAGYLSSLPVEEEAPGTELQPLVLVIDQFEELFTTYPSAWEQRGAFFTQLDEAMQSDPSLWVVLAMREDYVAALDPYARLLPGRLRTRYSMERMGPEAALRAVTLPVNDLRPFEEEAARNLVTNLRMIVTGRDEHNQPVFAAGQFVEPVQLQVVCFQLWDALRDSPGSSITQADLERLAQGKELARFVSAALANFYVQAIQDVLKQFPQVSERRLREWFSRELITEGETRGAVRQGKDHTGAPPNDLPNSVVRALQSRFIIRSESRGDTTWYELSHDRFVGPILLSNREWQQHNPQPLESAAQAWINAGEDPARLLDGSLLRQAQALLKADPDEVSPEARRFIEASQDLAEQRSSRRQRLAMAGLALVLVIVIGLLIQAVGSGQALARQNATVIAAQRREVIQNQTITVALGQVQVEKATAEIASTRAFEQKEAADAARVLEAGQRQRAEAESRLAQARELSTLSETFLDSQPDLGLLLGIESLRVSNTWEGRKALLNGLQTGLAREIAPEGPAIFGAATVQALAFSPDGKLLAIGTARGLQVWDLSSQRFASLPDRLEPFVNVYTLAFNRQGTLLAVGDATGLLGIWNLATNEVKQHPLGSWVYSLAFHPDGNLLAMTTYNSRLILWDAEAGRPAQAWANSSIPAFSGLAWAKDGSRLATGSIDGYLAIWDFEQQPAPRQLANVHQESVRMVWVDNDQFLISAGREGSLARWNAETRTRTGYEAYDQMGKFLSIAASPDGSLLVTGNEASIFPLTLWDPLTLTPIEEDMGQHDTYVQALAFSAQGDRMASGDGSGKVVFWRVRTQQPLGREITRLPGGEARALGVDAQGLPFALYGDDRLQVWSADDSLTAPALDAAPGALKTALAAGPSGPFAATGDASGLVTFYQLTDGQPFREAIRAQAGTVDSLALAADGSALVVWGGKQIQLYRLAAGQPPAPVMSSAPFDPGPAAVRLDGRMLAIAAGKTGLGLIDTTTRQVLSRTPTNTGPDVTSLALSPDGALLAIGYADGNIALRDGQNQRPIGQFDWQPDGPVVGLVFSQPPGGALRLYSLTQPGTLMEWDVDLDSWVQRACALAGRSLSETEWEQYLPAGIIYQPECESTGVSK